MMLRKMTEITDCQSMRLPQWTVVDHGFYVVINPLTAGAEYIRFFNFYWHIKYHVLNMLKTKCDTNH